MLTCKEVAKCLADGDYAELPRWRRFFLKCHTLLCFVCGRYHRHLMRFQDGVRRYRYRESFRAAPPDPNFRLQSDEREAIRQTLQSHSDQDPRD